MLAKFSLAKAACLCAGLLTAGALYDFSRQSKPAPPPSPSAVAAQPAGERQAQDALPQSHDTLWQDFADCRVDFDDKHYVFTIDLTRQVRRMDGETIIVSGFMLPLEPSETFHHFLLSKRTPTCPFCPPGAPNEMVEVFSKEAVRWQEALAHFQGRFKLTENGEMGVFFQLKDAVA